MSVAPELTVTVLPVASNVMSFSVFAPVKVRLPCAVMVPRRALLFVVSILPVMLEASSVVAAALSVLISPTSVPIISLLVPLTVSELSEPLTVTVLPDVFAVRVIFSSVFAPVKVRSFCAVMAPPLVALPVMLEAFSVVAAALSVLIVPVSVPVFVPIVSSLVPLTVNVPAIVTVSAVNVESVTVIVPLFESVPASNAAFVTVTVLPELFVKVSVTVNKGSVVAAF